MRAITKRLRRLEERFGPAPATWETRHLQARLEAARRRCGLPPISPERFAELQGMSIIEILIAGRQRVWRELESGKGAAAQQTQRAKRQPT